MVSVVQTPPRRHGWLVLGGFLLLCLAVGYVGGRVTAPAVASWYPALVKPSFNPPDWIFAPIWTVLYVLMGIAAWRVWRMPPPGRRRALGLFLVQLALNLGWSLVFFGLQAVGAALIEIGVLFSLIIATMIAFWRLDRWAGLLFLPYAVWVGFAAILNFTIWRLN